MDEDKVTVHVEADYDVVSVALSEFGADTAEGWEQLRELLHGRPGWRYSIFGNGPDELVGGWAFPEYGRAAVLIVFAETDRFRVYDHTPDDDFYFSDVKSLRAHLASIEDDREQSAVTFQNQLRAGIRASRDRQSTDI